MFTHIGYIDSDGHPRVKLQVKGGTAGLEMEIDAMIDTGFSGFLMLPIDQALPLALEQMGAEDYNMADGSRVNTLLAKGSVTIGHFAGMDRKPASSLVEIETVEGVFLLGGDEAMVGMEFLRALDKTLVAGKFAALVDDATFSRLTGDPNVFLK